MLRRALTLSAVFRRIRSSFMPHENALGLVLADFLSRFGFTSWLPAVSVAALALSPLAAQAQEGRPLRIYLRAGLKTHGPGQHDYPQFLADWSKLLTEHGAV